MKKLRSKKNEIIDQELFNLFRDVFPDLTSCIKAVRDAQKAHVLFNKHAEKDVEFNYETLLGEN